MNYYYYYRSYVQAFGRILFIGAVVAVVVVADTAALWTATSVVAFEWTHYYLYKQKIQEKQTNLNGIEQNEHERIKMKNKI